MPFTVNIYRNGTELTEKLQVQMTLFDEFLIIFMRNINKVMLANTPSRSATTVDPLRSHS